MRITFQARLIVALLGVCIAVAVLVGGCSVGRPFLTEGLSEIKVGITTKEDVVKILGEPYRCSETNIGESALLNYTYARSGQAKSLDIFTGTDGKVSDWRLIYYDSGRRSPISQDELLKIKQGMTTKGEVIALLGKPTYEILDSSGMTAFQYLSFRYHKKYDPMAFVVSGVVGGLLNVKTTGVDIHTVEIRIRSDNVVESISTHLTTTKYR